MVDMSGTTKGTRNKGERRYYPQEHDTQATLHPKQKEIRS